MNSDISEKWFNSFHASVEKNVTLVLKNGRKVSGRIGGYIKGNETDNEPFILRWHILPMDENPYLGMDEALSDKGEYIEQKDISLFLIGL